MSENPFVPGAKVCLITGGYHRVRPNRFVERVIDKVYKNGRFVLVDDPGRTQYRVWAPEDSMHRKHWYARGANYGDEVLPICPETMAQIRTGIAAYARWERLQAVSSAMAALKLSEINDTQLALLENALGISPPEA